MKKLSNTEAKLKTSVAYKKKRVFCKISVLKNFAKFTEKDLCLSFCFNKVKGLQVRTLL